MKEQDMNDFCNSSNLPINGYVPKETDKIYYDFGKYIPLDGLNPEDIVKMMQNNEEIEDKENKITISGSVVQNETNQLYYILLKASEILKEDVNIHMTVDENEEEIIMKENTQEATSTEPVNKYCKITNVRISTSSENDNTIYIDNIYNQNGSGNFNITLFDVIENEENKISETEHEYGTNIQLTVNDIEGYELTKWEVISDSNTITGNTNTIEFIMPEENVVIKCYYTLRQYAIKFVNGGNTLQETTVNYGDMPTYTGETPTKASDGQYTYTFKGWEPEISEVTGEATYTATFVSTLRQYTIKFMNGDKTLQETTVNYGEMPTYTGETPTKASDGQYTYTFKGWEPEISEVTGEATYTAKFESKVRQYAIKFVNGGNTLQETTVNYGEMPTYTGETPTKASDGQYTYTFKGWEPEISEVSGDQTYTAQFEMHEYENEYEYIYLTDCSETPTSGATATTSGSIGTADTNGFTFIDGINESTPNTQLLNSSAGYTLTFEPNLDLSNYDNVKLDIWWAASSSQNSGIEILINDSQVGIDRVNDDEEHKKVRIITTNIDNNSIENLTIKCYKSNEAILFRIGIKGTPKEYLLTVNENEIGNIKVGEDISQYLTFEEKEGMTHKWMEGETEFIGNIMPNRDLILTSVYTEVSTNSKTIYYGAVNTNEINTLTSNDIQELEHYDYVDGEEKAVIFMLPIRPDLWEEYYTYEDNGNTQEMQEWEQRNNYDYFIAAPSNIVSLVLKNGIGAEHDIAAHETININGIEYIKYYTNLGLVAEEEQSATIPMNITIN